MIPDSKIILYFLLGLVFSFPAASFGQANLKAGYIITNTGDTLKGYVDYKERVNNPQNVSFTPAVSEKLRKFSIKECLAYGIDHMESYERFEVNVSTSRMDISRLSVGLDTGFRRDTVFLKVLQKGKIFALYAYTDNIKERFYLMPARESEPVELMRNIYMAKDENAIRESRRYIHQLNSEIMKIGAESKVNPGQVRNLKYDRKSLLKIVSQVNEVQQEQRSQVPGTRLFLGTGLSANKAAYSGNNDLSAASAKSKTFYAPLLSGGIDVFLNPAIGKTFVRTEVSFLTSKNEVSLETKDSYKSFLSHSFERLGFCISPQVIHNIYNAPGFKVFAGVGFGLNFSRTSNNRSIRKNYLGESTVIENNIELENFNYSFLARTGVVIHKRVELSLAYLPPVPITDYVNFSVTAQRVSLGLNYFFGKN